MLLVMLLSFFISTFAWKCNSYFHKTFSHHKNRNVALVSLYSNYNDDTFNPGEFNDFIKNMNPDYVNKFKNPNPNEIRDLNINNQEIFLKEELSRKFAYEDYELPTLPDCNNYYSGKYGSSFWLQNADQVFAYIPLSNEVAAKEITIKFDAKGCSVKVQSNSQKQDIRINTPEKIIPDGCFWTIEISNSPSTSSTTTTTQRYILLDMEKRLRMMNWKNLFTDKPGEESAEDMSERRKDLLQKLFAANKGVGNLSGKTSDNEIESINDMLNNPELMKMINSEINTEPRDVSSNDSTRNNPTIIDGTEDFLKRLQEQSNNNISNENNGEFNESEIDMFEGFDSVQDILNNSNNIDDANNNSSEAIDAEFEDNSQ